MTVSLADLLPLPTKEEFLDKFVGVLRLAGFPTSSWQTTSFMRQTVESESALFVDLATMIQNVAKGGYIKYAGDVNDKWVDLCAENVFAEARKAAVFTQGSIVLTDAAGVGPVPITAGSFWVGNATKTLRYFSITGGTLPLNGSVTISVQAETAGSLWNTGNGEITQLLTPVPGVTVTNPALDTGTWITQQGANIESNAALVQRCLDKWSLIGSGSDEGAYRYYATTSSPEITRARPYSPGAGSVRVVVAGDSGPVSATALNAAATLIESKRPLGVPDVIVVNATPYVQSLAGVIYPTPGRDPAATIAAVQASVNEFQRGLKLGARVSRERIISAIFVNGVDDIDLTAPLTDADIGPNDVWLPSYALIAG